MRFNIKLFEEVQIGRMVLPNRIIRSATHEGLADEAGNPTDRLIRKYVAMAKAETGMIVTGYAGIRQDGKSAYYRMLMMDSDERIESHRRLTDEVHQYRTPVVLQIAHCGRQTRSRVTGLPTVAPSRLRDKLFSEDVPNELTDAEIGKLIEDFADAAERGQKAGYDGVQIHLAHGYLLSSFLSPHMNRRSDRWGGSTENRFRIVKAVFEEARNRVGEYPLMAKINGFEASRRGIKPDEAVKIAMLLEKAGCDAIEVSCGIAEEGFVMARGRIPYEAILKYNFSVKDYPAFVKRLAGPYIRLRVRHPKPRSLYNVETAGLIKQHVGIPVIAVGGIRGIDDMQAIVTHGQADFVSMSRPFIIEPEIVRKLREGKQSRSKCIDCNYCGMGVEEQPLKCYYGRL